MSDRSPKAPPLTLVEKILFSFSAVSNSVKMRALSSFLLLFYNQVLGLPAHIVSAMIMVALIFDAFVDPLVGQISDNFHSPWGRRHPFMYAAIIPLPIAFFLLWNPPANWEGVQLAGYLLVLLLSIRFLDTFFELPSSALLPELTRDYDERTQVVALRNFAGIACGTLFTIAAYQVFLRERPDGSGGVLAGDGYPLFGLVGAIVIFASMVISAVGTHHRIPYLSAAPSRKVTPKIMWSEMLQTLNNRPFVILSVVGMFSYIALGIKGAIDIYFNLFFWEFSQAQLALITTMYLAAAVTGALLAPLVAKAVGKKYGLMISFALYGVIGPGPVLLRLLGLMPPNGTDLLFAIMLAETMLTISLSVIAGIMLTAMIADVVEDAQVKTGRRSEGLLNAIDSLFKKVVSGVGVFASGVMLSVAQFPQGAERGAVPQEALRTLGMIYVPTLAIIYSLVIAFLCFYTITRKSHEENLRLLEAQSLVP